MKCVNHAGLACRAAASQATHRARDAGARAQAPANRANPLVSGALALSLALTPLPAHALTTVELKDLKYEVVECAKGTRTMAAGVPACIVVSARATNPSAKELVNVDVFGRILDSNGDTALDRDEASDAGRVSNIKAVSPGESTVEFSVTIASRALDVGPLKFKAFKGRSYPGLAFGNASPLIDEEDAFGYMDLN
mmetsp:Transcript_4392/g.15249  ORF Transcript_4392/g.15249 Transcript_4392/m.15249 type:complete len:195 (+) Transcript_4392:3-587(+)